MFLRCGGHPKTRGRAETGGETTMFRRLLLCCVVALLIGCGGAGEDHASVSQALATFVQVASSSPQSPKSSLPLAFGAAQTAGNFNVVIVGWNDTTSNVTDVADTRGNVYQLAIGPTR